MTDDKWYESIQHMIVWALVHPQGSILGPLLFSIYTNDLTLASQKCSIQSYVDVTKLVISFKMKDSSEVFGDLRDDLHTE